MATPAEESMEGLQVENLLVQLKHYTTRGQTEVIFNGEGFDDTNDEIIVDILQTAAEALGYVMHPADQVIYEET